MSKEWWENESMPIDDVQGLQSNAKRDFRIYKYYLQVPDEFHTRIFSDDEKRCLRPIAETLAMLNGNAFFGNELQTNTEWYEQYLPEAAALFFSNGGHSGWLTEVSWLKHLHHNLQVPCNTAESRETKSVKD